MSKLKTFSLFVFVYFLKNLVILYIYLSRLVPLRSMRPGPHTVIMVPRGHLRVTSWPHKRVFWTVGRRCSTKPTRAQGEHANSDTLMIRVLLSPVSTGRTGFGPQAWHRMWRGSSRASARETRTRFSSCWTATTPRLLMVAMATSPVWQLEILFVAMETVCKAW